MVTPKTQTDDFGLLGVTADRPLDPATRVLVRVREDGDWGAWTVLPVSEHAPDPGSVEARESRFGTEPLITDEADGVQVRIDTPTGKVPAGTSVALVDTASAPADATLTGTLPVSSVAAAPIKPTIITRAQWGADESLRGRAPRYSPTIKVGFVHHTASTSGYSADDAPRQMRNLYAWYVKGLRYSDMAYNFLVDRFGRLYEGRAGGMDRPVIGGHTAGFNNDTFAVSAIGNFDTFNPAAPEAQAMYTSIAELMSWKLGLHNRDPLGRTTLVSDFGGGTSRYPPGAVATTQVIAGHGDIGSTACPGRYLHQYLPTIRNMARSILGPAVLDPVAAPASTPYGATAPIFFRATTSEALTAWTLTVTSVCGTTPVRTVTGAQAAAGAFESGWDGRDDAGQPVLPGTYRLTLAGTTAAGVVAYPGGASATVAATATSPLGPCASVQRLGQVATADQRAAAAVRIGRETVPTATTVVIASAEAAYAPEALLTAPFATAKGAPMLLGTARGLPATVTADLAGRRVTAAYLVGSTKAIGAAAEGQLRSLGIAVTRIQASSRAALAAKLAVAMAPRTRAVAVQLDDSAGLGAAAALAAAGPAARTGTPLLVVGRSGVPAVTADALARLGVTSTWVAGSPSLVPDRVAAALPGAARITGTAASTTAQAVAEAFADPASAAGPVPLDTVLLARSGTADLPGGVLAAAFGRVTLLTSGTAVPSTLRTFVGARQAIDRLVVVATPGRVPDTRVPSLVDALAAQGTLPAPAPVAPVSVPGAVVGPLPMPAATPPDPVPAPSVQARPRGVVRARGTVVTPIPTPIPAPSPTVSTPAVPATFGVSGAGYGHGVGMSQIGAKGQALEGRTAPQILQHYFAGTSVQPVRDDVELRVGLLTKVASTRLRLDRLDGEGTPAVMELAVAGAAPVLVDPGVAVTVRTAAAGTVTATRTGPDGAVTVLASGATLAVRWSGTRLAGDLGAAPALLNVPSPGQSFASARHRYRYGWVEITPSGTSRLNVVNLVRLHDEYLPGIAEVSPAWPDSATEAQVIAARSYALAKYGTGAYRASCRCHVDDGGGPYYDQTFIGWAMEAGAYGPGWRDDVARTSTSDTEGYALLYQGAPVAAFYTASTGGRTQDVRDVWGGTLPWAVGADDHWSLDATLNPQDAAWSGVVRSQAAVALAFGLPDVVRVDLGDRTAAGAVRRAVAWSSAGASSELAGGALRSRLGLRSAYVWAITPA